MRKENLRRKGFLRPSVVVFLILVLLAPGLFVKERKGAQIIVTKRDGKVFQDELLAVKGEDLVFLDKSTSGEVTESLVDIQAIKIAKKSKWVSGLVIGAIAGGIIGALSGKSSRNLDPNEPWDMTSGQAATAGAAGFGLVGAAIGSNIGEKAITIENTDPKYLAGISARLRKLARDRS
jgi:hypothetical protein